VTDPLPPTPVVPRRRWWLPVLLLVPFTFFFWTGNRGIDFGRHWDEPLILANLHGSLKSRLLLPTSVNNYDRPGLAGGNYEYPSVLYWVGIATAVTSGPELRDSLASAAPLTNAELERQKPFILRLRRVCLAISSLTILAVGCLGYALTRRWPAGLLAAALLATSWQFAYHARWIAPDEIMVVWSTVCLALCTTAVHRRSVRAAVWAAVAAGLSAGTKYPGGLLMIPVVTAGWMARPNGYIRRIGRIVELALLSVAVFLVTTPGALAQPWNFISWVQFDREHYARIGHFGHDILNHTAMAVASGEFIWLKLLSAERPIAIGLSALVLIGATGLCVRSWRLALVLLPFPLIYCACFSQQIVLLVRNLLVIAPIMAALAAVGTVVIGDLLSRASRILGWAAFVPVLAAVAWDGVWVEYASESMGKRQTPEWQIRQVEAYAAHHPELRLFPSETIAAATGWPLVPPPKAGTRDVVVSFAIEDGNPWLWPANVPGLTLATFGAYCVDFDSYPNWQDNRIVVLDAVTARRVPVGNIERAVRRRDLSTAVPDQKLLVYMDCGGTPQADGGGVRIRPVRGTGYPCQFDVAVPQPDSRSIEADQTEVVYEITGLDPKRAYTVGWSWWDWNTGHRVESAWAVGTDLTARLCGPTHLPAWPLVVNPVKHKLSPWWPPPYAPRAGIAQHADYAVPLPPGVYRDGRFSFTVRKESGPDVVLTGVWVTTPLR
jgi:hypothetical protein